MTQVQSAVECGTAIHKAFFTNEVRPVRKVTPCVGDSIEIKHEVKRDTSGQFVLGLQRRDRSINTEITRTYLDGTVATGRGDVWEVKLSGGRCKWETVNHFIKKDEEV